MKVEIQTIRDKMQSVLESKGYAADDIDFLIDMYLGGELRGHTSHGLASFPGFATDDFSNLPEPEVIVETHSTFIIDAKSNSGAIVGKRAADEAMKRADNEIVGTAFVKNMDSWLRPGAIAQYIADKGYMAIVVNDGGGSSIAPPGGYDPVLATNPIAYGIPTTNGALVVDMATSKRAWGQVRLANKYGTDLPADTFYDDKGELTLDPKEAHSVMPFGDYKGFALALMIEVLCGSLIGMENMMVDTNAAGSQFGVRLQERGGFILVIDPSKTAVPIDFKQANSTLLEKIKATHTLPNHEIRIPGEHANDLYTKHMQQGSIEIPDELWKEFQAL